jgi:xanthine/uracil/vitamin C permease (AzgA family)
MSARKVSNKQIRDIQRATHLVAAFVLVLYVYIPLLRAPLLTTVVQFAVLPLLAVTGLLMWQWTRLCKWLTAFWGSRPLLWRKRAVVGSQEQS